MVHCVYMVYRTRNQRQETAKKEMIGQRVKFIGDSEKQ